MIMNSKYVYAFAGLLLGMTACSNEDLMPTSGQQRGETVFVSLKVDRNKAETRTIIEETDVTDGVGLSNVWAAGDQVTLVAADGAVAGTLTLQGEGGSSEGIFSGEATIADGEYTVWYLGDARAGNPYAEFNEQGEFVNALATPDCPVSGDFGDLNKGDLMNSQVQIIVKDGKATVAESVTLASQMAMAHFTLSMDGLDTALAADGAKLTLSYTVGVTPYSYIITNKSADVFVPLFPGEYAPSFTLVSGEKTYTYAFKSATQVNAGVYYCGAKNSTTGKNDGITVTLKDPTVTDPYEGYENEDPRNPLHKFAKTNLVRVGERGSLVNGFADSETENGALYQWGRNHGYMDNAGFFADYETDSDFINFEDAFGDIEIDEDASQRTFDFYAYYPGGESLYTGTGGYILGNNVYDPFLYYAPISYDRPKFYDSLEILQSHTDKFFMDATEAEYLGNLGGFLWYDTNSDYWLNSFGDGGITWTERAKNCGYENTNPCPDGWRLPTLAEFKAISPEQNISNSRNYLTTLLKNYSELRYDAENDIDYAIRWVYETTGLKIQCLIVSSDFKKSQLSSIRWDKESGVVTRIFPFTGAITTVGGYDGLDNISVALPYHRGTPDAGVFDRLMIGIGNNTNQALGGYWISEKDNFFKFMAGEKVGLRQGQLMITDAAPSWGYAIRPVMAK